LENETNEMRGEKRTKLKEMLVPSLASICEREKLNRK